MFKRKNLKEKKKGKKNWNFGISISHVLKIKVYIEL